MQHALILASEQTSSWLTPIWLVSLGLVLGFGLFMLVWCGIGLLARVPVINTLNDRPSARLVAGLLLSAVVFGFGLWLSQASGWLSSEQAFRGPAADKAEAAADAGSESSGNWVVALVGLAVAAPFVGFGLIAATSARRRDEVLRTPWEGLLYWLNWICAGAAVFVIVGVALWATRGLEIFTVVDQPDQFVRSLARLPAAGTNTRTFTIPVAGESDTGTPIDVAFRGNEIRWIQFETNQPMHVAAAPITADLLDYQYYRNVTGVNEAWVTQASANNDTPIPLSEVRQMYAVNLGDAPGKLVVRWHCEPDIIQVAVIPLTAVCVAALYLVILLLAGLAPKISAVALATFKTEVAQPIFTILALFGGIFILASIFIPYFTFGDDIKMYQEAGLTVIRVLGIFLAVWAASKSIAEEIEGRTALTVLSKPIGRVQFVLGKFLGITAAVGLLIVVLGVWFTIWTSFKPIYDTYEASERIYDWKVCFSYIMANLPALILIFMECIVFVSISVAISTRVGILPNFLICFAIYVLGHLTPTLVAAKQTGSIEQVAFVGRLIAIIFPVLDNFDSSTAVMTSTVIPFNYLAWAGLYTLLYGTIMLLLSLLLFQDRDLA
jgi:ABC-type transport system involved in multi-copper enzyme maturation permease subunit